MNEKLAEIFFRLSSLYESTDTHRSKAYARGAQAIVKCKEKIISGEQAQKLPGIGKSIAEKIDEYFETGTLAIFETLSLQSHQQPTEEKEKEDKAKEEEEVLKLFESIDGVGPVTAKKWYDLGYRNLDDLKDVKMTPKQQLGYKYYDDVHTPIPREEITRFKEMFADLIGVDFEICGSYRRGKETSGDIDCLVCGDEDINMDSIVDGLMELGIIKHTYVWGTEKYSGLICVDKILRQLDILIIEPESWPYAILYFTGSKEHNIEMRNRAKEKGWRLNEYGLYDKEWKRIEARSEKEIFEVLEVEYLEPEKR